MAAEEDEVYSDVPCGAGPSVEAVGEARTLPDPAAPSALVLVSSPGKAEGTEIPAPDGGGGGEVRTCRSVALMLALAFFAVGWSIGLVARYEDTPHAHTRCRSNDFDFTIGFR